MIRCPALAEFGVIDAPLLNVQVDGVWMQFPKGLNVVEIARRAAKFIPHYCYHPKLSISGNCRMCLIEIEKVPKLQIACNTRVTDGMKVSTTSEKTTWITTYGTAHQASARSSGLSRPNRRSTRTAAGASIRKTGCAKR